MEKLTLQAEGTDAFSQFHLYVCSALLVKYSERLREMDFQVRPSCSLPRCQAIPPRVADIALSSRYSPPGIVWYRRGASIPVRRTRV